MFRSATMLLVPASAVGTLALACAPVVAHRAASPPPTRGVRTAALDSGTTRRLCAAPDSVLAGRAPCVLRDQRAPLRVF